MSNWYWKEVNGKSGISHSDTKLTLTNLQVFKKKERPEPKCEQFMFHERLADITIEQIGKVDSLSELTVTSSDYRQAENVAFCMTLLEMADHMGMWPKTNEQLANERQ